MKNLLFISILFLFSCIEKSQPIIDTIKNQSANNFNIDSLRKSGFQIFAYYDDELNDSIYMQEYFMAFLKSGDNRSQDKNALDSLQKLHREHLGRMYELGFADISGPFGDAGEIRGVTIYNTPTIEFADSLANLDPMVKSGRLKIELHPWWAGKGYPLR